MPLNVFDDDSVALIRRIVQMVQQSPQLIKSLQTFETGGDWMPPTYQVKTPAGGIPAATLSGSDLTPGSAACTIWKRNGAGVLKSTGEKLMVYNTSQAAIPETTAAEAFIHVASDGFSEFYPIPPAYERVKMTQTGGSDGTASTQATWTYSIKDWTSTTTYATSVDPTNAAAAPGGMIFRPALGSLEAATEGYAMFVGGEPFIVSCNEGESVAPCSAVGGLSVAEQTSLSAVYLLGGM